MKCLLTTAFAAFALLPAAAMANYEIPWPTLHANTSGVASTPKLEQIRIYANYEIPWPLIVSEAHRA